MQQKSNIQLIREELEKKQKRFNVLESFVNKYNIKNNIFAFVGESLVEIQMGYFEPFKESSSLKEIMEGYREGVGIRICGDKYELGNLYANLSKTENINKVLEINPIQ